MAALCRGRCDSKFLLSGRKRRLWAWPHGGSEDVRAEAVRDLQVLKRRKKTQKRPSWQGSEWEVGPTSLVSGQFVVTVPCLTWQVLWLILWIWRCPFDEDGLWFPSSLLPFWLRSCSQLLLWQVSKHYTQNCCIPEVPVLHLAHSTHAHLPAPVGPGGKLKD